MPLVTESLSRKSPFTWTIKLLYCTVSVITIPLMLFPVMSIVDGYIKYGTAMSRLLIVMFSSSVALGFYNNLPHVIAVTGAISCTPIAFTLPALFHLKLGLESSKLQRIINQSLVFLSFLILVFTLEEVLRTWNLKVSYEC